MAFCLLIAAAADQQPQELEVSVRHIQGRFEGMEEIDPHFPDWPEDGVLVLYFRLPSSTRNMTTTDFDRHVMLVITSSPHNYLQLEGELRYIYSWTCNSTKRQPKDVCRYCYTFNNNWDHAFHLLSFFFSLLNISRFNGCGAHVSNHFAISMLSYITIHIVQTSWF